MSPQVASVQGVKDALSDPMVQPPSFRAALAWFLAAHTFLFAAALGLGSL